MNDERRGAIRIKSTLFVQYCFNPADKLQQWDITTVKDISETGICILTGKKFNPEAKILLRLKIPSRPFELTQITGKVVGCKDTGFGQTFITRIQFFNVPEETQLLLHEYIRWIVKNEKTE